MRISYECGDKVNVIAGPYINSNGIITEIDGDKVTIKTSLGATFNTYMKCITAMNSEQLMLMSVKALYKDSDSCYYTLGGASGYWKLDDDYSSFICLNNAKLKQPAFDATVKSRITRALYKKFVDCGIPMDGSEFWIYNSATQLYFGPVQFLDGSLYSRKGYVEFKENYKAVSLKEIAAKFGIQKVNSKPKAKVKTLGEIRKATTERFTEELEDKMYEERIRGAKLEELSKKYGFALMTVQRHLIATNIRKTGLKCTPAPYTTKALAAYRIYNNTGKSMEDIAKDYGVAVNTVSVWIRKVKEGKIAA